MSVLRNRQDEPKVSNAELFFDLVYVFAVTQLSHHLLSHPTIDNAGQTAVLLGMVWQAWVYTTWTTNFLDPRRIPVRLMLFATSLGSLVLSAALPRAFENWPWAVAGAYAAMQIGRSAFAVVILQLDDPKARSLRLNYERILSWCTLSGAVALAGAATDGHIRELLWLAAVAIDLLGGAVNFWTPGLGRTPTEEWTIAGGHFAERCQAFVLIALGESVVVIGETLSDSEHVTGQVVLAFVAAFLGALALWWMYFDRSAESAAEIIAESENPGVLGRSAYHFIHPLMVAGIIVTASADERVVDHPGGHADRPTVWLMLGGTALFIAGHGFFKAVVWKVVPWSRIAAVVLLLVLVSVGTYVSPLLLGFVTLVVVVAVLLTDRATTPSPRDHGETVEISTVSP